MTWLQNITEVVSLRYKIANIFLRSNPMLKKKFLFSYAEINKCQIKVIFSRVKSVTVARIRIILFDNLFQM